MTDALTQIAELVKAESGILAARHNVLIPALAKVAPGLEPGAFRNAVQHGADGRALLLRLVDELTINETYFCRERGQLDAIPWQKLHEAALARGEGRVRVWSAACSSGEEAYSLAISAWEALGPESPPIEILGTDIAPSMVVRARGGRYRSRSVRELDERARARWFAQVGDEWEVVPELRRLVTFEVHNLLHEARPLPDGRKFDLILCRNVLIYFDAAMARDATARLRGALHPGGLLVLGSADALGETSRALDAITNAQRARLPPERARPPVDPVPNAPAVESDVVDADSCFLRGVQQLESGEGEQAVRWFRQAIWLDESFGLAVFALGRAYDVIGNRGAATRAYRRALRTLGEDGRAPHSDVEDIALVDVVAACHARLLALEGVA